MAIIEFIITFPYLMHSSDLIALAALLVAAPAAWYARQARDAARTANDISIYLHIRPIRLAVYQAMYKFAHFCSTYRTLQYVKAVHGTREIVEYIENFKWEIDKYGPLAMPDIEKKVEEFQSMAWQLQRVLDRIAGGQNNPLDQAYETAEENLDDIIDWFSNEYRGLRASFQPYLDVV